MAIITFFTEICVSDVYRLSTKIKMVIKLNYFQIISKSGSKITAERLPV